MSEKGTLTVHDIPDEELLRRAVRGVVRRRTRHATPAWVKVQDVFALGSTYSGQLCRRFRIDPFATTLRDLGDDEP